MEQEWQSWAAIVVVAITVAAFAWRHARRRRRSAGPGCGQSCGCDAVKRRSIPTAGKDRGFTTPNPQKPE